jgi:hypothetical protein
LSREIPGSQPAQSYGDDRDFTGNR